jgi:hypothetical protein
VGGKPGHPQQRPDSVYGVRAFDAEPHREELRQRGLEPKLAKRNTEHGSGLGIFRWVVERMISWLNGFRKLPFVTEKGKECSTLSSSSASRSTALGSYNGSLC